ncbi:MAG: hypothetical protein M3317_10910 [Actinomycetota bacterium]|nr:hypothetical protein [Actinomycetota bacterium]
MDLPMVRDRLTGRIVYIEQRERRLGETPRAYVRRSVRREAWVWDRFKEETSRVIVGWGAGSVEEILESYPEYGPVQESEDDGQVGQDAVEW